MNAARNNKIRRIAWAKQNVRSARWWIEFANGSSPAIEARALGHARDNLALARNWLAECDATPAVRRLSVEIASIAVAAIRL